MTLYRVGGPSCPALKRPVRPSAVPPLTRRARRAGNVRARGDNARVARVLAQNDQQVAEVEAHRVHSQLRL